MEREHWIEISQAISEVDQRWKHNPRQQHRTAVIVRVYLWAAAHNCSVLWATRPHNWDPRCLPHRLPQQSTLSRRCRSEEFWQFLQALGRRLAGRPSGSLLKRLDGKPLVLPAHSSDRHATWGRGVGQQARGYKLHAIWSDRPMPEQWALTPLDVSEKDMARRLMARLSGCGYLLADGHYDASDLYDRAARVNHQLLSPRQHPGTGLGHHYQSPHRLRCIQMLEQSQTGFGWGVYPLRKQIERDFGNLCSYSGGLLGLPPWVRRPWRVRLWVHAKLLLNAARIRCLRRAKAKQAPADA